MRPPLLCCATLPTAACTRVVGGTALPAFGAGQRGVLDVATILLGQSRMRAITGAGEHLTIIASMDGRYRVLSVALLEVTFCGFPESCLTSR
ncbi:hypothetical protein AWC15_14525 [Mycobacterium lacus]|nr:hypothetical protein AWC15_14525 [Mycobacterium lacus]